MPLIIPNRRRSFAPATGSASPVPAPSPGPPINTKGVALNSSTSFFINAPGVNGGKGLSLQFFHDDGSNDAGTDHQVWRLGPHYVGDTLTTDPAAGGYKTIAVSDGSQAYAICQGSPATFGGEFHGGEVANSQQWTCDGVNFDPTTQNPTGKKFELNRTSTVTWSTTDGHSANITYYCKFETDNKLEQSFTVTSADATLVDYTTQATANLTLAFVDPRFSNLYFNGTSIHTLTGSETYTISGGATQSAEIKLVDPVLGDYWILDFSISGKTVQGIFIVSNGNYNKVYIQQPGGALGSYSVSQTQQWFTAQPVPQITAPYTDSFTGSALVAGWKQVVGSANPIVVSGGDAVWTSAGANNAFVFPINPTNGPGTYHLELDYTTDGAYTGAQVDIARSDTFSTVNPLTTLTNLNSTGGATYAVDFTINAGESPWVKITQAVTSGRVIRFHEMRITKTG